MSTETICLAQIAAIDCSLQAILPDVYLAQIDDQRLLATNVGYLYDFASLESMAAQARTLLRVVDSIRSTYDTGEFNQWVDSLNQQRLKLHQERDQAHASALKAATSRGTPTQVYLMRNEQAGLYKIGRSRNPSTRERTLQATEPQITLIKAYPGTSKDEAHLHEFFAHKRIRGEWFNLDEADLTLFHSYFK
ncbi:GIY-YIG nuclease family protein [Spirosoma fluminis]